MKIELWQLFLAAVGYLGLLFLIAYAAEREWIPRKLVQHPLSYALSLGVYATSWSYYGSVGFAAKSGYLFLTIYLGVTFAFILAPLLLLPIMRLVKEYQLTSLADLFAFRFGQFTGSLVTLFMLVGTLPYISLQIRAVTESVQVLTQEAPSELLALVFCITLTLFAILFGARHITPREKHEGLVAAIAFESAIKLLALLSVGLFSLYGIFGDLGGLGEWLKQHPEALQRLYQPVQEGPWHALILLSFAAAFLLPRQFHMIFTENINPRGLKMAVWMVPLYLLLLNLPILPILWAGEALGTETVADFYVLGITTDNSLLTLIAFIGGISAASAMMIVTTLALAAMCMNNLFLPFLITHQRLKSNLYRGILWSKRLLITAVIAAGYGFYRVIVHNEGLAQLGLISFVAVAQLLPSFIALMFWPRATHIGVVAGLIGGSLVWFIQLILPLLINSHILTRDVDLSLIFQQEGNIWSATTFWSLSANLFLLVIGSLLVRPDETEQEAAQACSQRILSPLRGRVHAYSPEDFEQRLSRLLGEETAQNEVALALKELGMDYQEQRPAELRLLREQIERNLSGLLGPALAKLVVDDRLRLEHRSHIALAQSMRFMETRLERSRNQLQGAVAELDALRRYHRQVLVDLPIGVCAIDPDGEILIWNLAMRVTSELDQRYTVGKPLKALPEPWGSLLDEFARSSDQHRYKQPIRIGHKTHWLNLHKAEIAAKATGGVAILVEDRTQIETLEEELIHSERLASIGRFSAGVAHEIGNPLTGIACLAQNLSYAEEQTEIEQTQRDILEQTSRISQIVQNLLNFSHRTPDSELHQEPFSLHACIDDAIRLVQLEKHAKQIHCINHSPKEAILVGDKQAMQQVFVNLLSNACDASEIGAEVRIESEQHQEWLLIYLIDHGKGIPKDQLAQVFEPFFTSKPVGEGTGLGLPLAHGIISQHGGQLSVQSVEHQGTTFTLKLPHYD